MCRKPRRVGSKKGKGRGFVLAVFGKVEMDAADQVPGRITPLQKFLNPAFRFRQFGTKCSVQRMPEIT